MRGERKGEKEREENKEGDLGMRGERKAAMEGGRMRGERKEDERERMQWNNLGGSE